MFHIINPSSIGIPERFQEIIVFLIVAMTLALAVRRSNALLISHAGIERERANLARNFSPTSSSNYLEMTNRLRGFTPRTSPSCLPISWASLPMPMEEIRRRSSAHCDNSMSGWNGKCSGMAERSTSISAMA
jgi:hypothetical protein